MEPQRVHILGASGSGTTTLGRALASAWSIPHADVDDYFWEPTDPPYTTKRDPRSRLHLMETVFLPRAAWILSGSLAGWGDELVRHFDCVIFVTLDPALRLDRLREREEQRYGSRIKAGGDLESGFAEFLDWAAGYDEPDVGGRSRARHEQWLATLPCPILRLDGATPTDELVAAIVDWNPRSAN